MISDEIRARQELFRRFQYDEIYDAAERWYIFGYVQGSLGLPNRAPASATIPDSGKLYRMGYSDGLGGSQGRI